MKREAVALREAAVDDCRFVWSCNNDPAARAVSLNKTSIPFEDHTTWYAHALADPAHAILIISQGDESLGVMRFRGEEEPYVSIALAAHARGRGVGKRALRAGVELMLADGAERVFAEIVDGNMASIRAFESAGFVPCGERDLAGERVLRYVFSQERTT